MICISTGAVQYSSSLTQFKTVSIALRNIIRHVISEYFYQHSRCSTILDGFNSIRKSCPTNGDPGCRFLVQNHSVWPNFAKFTSIIGKNVAIFLNSSSGSCTVE
jgi:hypothetical protein